MRKIFGVLCLIAVMGSWVFPLEAQTIKIGTADDNKMKERYQPLIDHLNKSGLGQFEFVFYRSVEELYGAFKANAVRIGFFGPVFYTKVHEETGAIPIVKDKPNASTIFVLNDSKIQDLSDLPGHRFAFGYYESTTSSLIPRMTLWQELGRQSLVGSEAAFDRDSGKVFYEHVGSHTEVVEAVISGKFDAGATVDVLFERNKVRGLRAIFTSEPYPGVPLVCHKDESKAFIEGIRRSLLSYRAPQDSSYHVFKTGATVASDEDYDAIRYLSSMVLRREYK